MKYLVVVNFMRHEDSMNANLVVGYNDDKDLTPRELMVKFVGDAQECYKANAPEPMGCINTACVVAGRRVRDGKFCPWCGNKIKPLNLPTDPDGFGKWMETWFTGTYQDLDQSFVEQMEERGWDLWNQGGMKSDRYVYISGIRDYIEGGDEGWYDEFGNVEKG